VYELCRYRNSLGPAIPERILTKPPSAELKPGQKDSDSLPPYEELDPILRGYVEEDLTPDELIAAGNRAETVARVIHLVDRSEYKRRPAPPSAPRSSGLRRQSSRRIGSVGPAWCAGASPPRLCCSRQSSTRWPRAAPRSDWWPTTSVSTGQRRRSGRPRWSTSLSRVSR